ncbi:mechanosensitive ion channel family protein [Tropicimonas sp. TH_r6]|uniref:mechanosensitive ion channel family protein n=1 Tax=Tropicimonas sp. TH_r6 TaxID=3082085 RepID=UPI0029535404|nr:mechanosensitive ion channel family protein [Tropicimonas sp. TH_r6]MDV7143853.1 mechanosensitive ion channel family protein [Tropicimonas sp. TH_r6]
MADISSQEVVDLAEFGNAFDRWADQVSMPTVIAVAVAFAVLVVFRKPIARVTMGLLARLLKQLQIALSDETVEKLYSTTEILLVSAGLLIAAEILAVPVFGHGILRRIVLSVAVMSVFSSWYQLTGPFLSVFRTGQIGDVQMEQDWITRVTKFAILLFGITSVLNVWDVDISGALTGVGVLGAGLAIAAQDLIRNLIAGMTNMSEKRFETGDAIEIEGVTIGTVERIDLRSTLIVGFDQIPRYVPNSHLSNSVVKNYTTMKHRRILVSVQRLMSATLQQAEDVWDGLRDHMRASGDFDLAEDAPKHVDIDSLGRDSINVRFYGRTCGPDYAAYLEGQERLAFRILELVAQAGTSLAYPTQTVHLRRPDDAIADPGISA